MRAERIAAEDPKDDELKQIKRDDAQMSAMLEALRQEKIQELRAAGVDEKYF